MLLTKCFSGNIIRSKTGFLIDGDFFYVQNTWLMLALKHCRNGIKNTKKQFNSTKSFCYFQSIILYLIDKIIL